MTWSFGKHYWRLLPGGLVTLVFAGLLRLGAIQPLEDAAYNLLFTIRGETAWDDRLVMVTIDEHSIQQLGRFPWSRQRYVELLNTLYQGNPSIIVFDLLFSEHSREDPALAQAMLQSGRVVLAQAQDRTGPLLLPVPELQDAAIATGHILHQASRDGVTRQVPLTIRDKPVLGLAAIQAYKLVQAPVKISQLDQPFWINWPGRVARIPQYSFIDVLRGQVPADAFNHKIVLIGMTAADVDSLITPFDHTPPASGVYLHAAIIHNVLQQNALQVTKPVWTWLMLFLGSPALSWVLSQRREGTQILVWAGLCLGWVGGSIVLFHLNYWVPIALPLTVITATTIAVLLNDRLRMNTVLQQQVQSLWRKYQPDLVQPASALAISPVGAIQGLGNAASSVTQLATLAEQFGKSQSTQAAIARSLSIGLIAADLDGTIWFCNPHACQWLSVQPGDPLTSSLVPNWMTTAQWQADLQQLMQHQPVLPREFQRDDRWFELKLEPLTYQVTVVPERSEPDRLDGLLLLLEDITLRKQVEVNLANQVQEHQRLIQLKDDFLSTVSHELRAPMANIKMAIAMLKIAKSDLERERYLKILQSECAREMELINDLLDLQRLEAGARIYSPETIDLQDWLPVLVEPFYERAEAQQQTLQVQLPKHLPSVVSDQPSLERIMVELVNNACKYTPPTGEIKVMADWSPTYVELVVQNSGAEIPPADLPRIFEKFYRVPRTDRWKRGGTGLGLALVKKLVEYLGGKIEVRSSAGQTTFIVQLPLRYQVPDLSESS
ncbi:CHASE2 domain-containing protein [Pantanalinema rosaneae CENA516]|uniref:CHASE2 domain-containing protein n=1 Tax=Pantanalinema rosaneae TaxID=1620701 RepID=UPI003D6EBF0C